MTIPARADRAGTPIAVLVVADVRFYREGLRDSLAARPGVVVAGAVRGSEAAAALAAPARPDVVVLDMATGDSLAVARTIASLAPAVRIVGFAVEEVDREILACAEAGIAAWVDREGSIADLVSAINHVVRDELVCSPRLASTLLRRLAALARHTTERGPADELTGREREILALIDRGLSNKEIAQRLHVEVATVKNHVHNILDKLHVSRRNQAAAFVRSGPAPTARPT